MLRNSRQVVPPKENDHDRYMIHRAIYLYSPTAVPSDTSATWSAHLDG